MVFSIPSSYLPVFGLFSVLLVAGMAWLLFALERHRRHRLDGFAQTDLLARLIAAYRPEFRLPLHVLVVAGTVLLLVAVAGPRWGSREFTGLRGSREILVLLDTSESMNAVNPAPDRLTRAREKVTSLLESFPGDRFGLIAFSGAAVLQCPLTKDHAYFKTVLHSVTTNTLTAEGTDIEAAFLEAEKLFEESRGDGRGAGADNRVVLLISDGEAVSGDAVSAARRMAGHGRVVVMGIGDPEGAEVAMPHWVGQRRFGQSSGASHWSKLDEENLAAIAVAGGGVYVRSTLGDDDLNVIARELAFLDGFRGEADPAFRKVNRYRWPLAAGALCFALEGAWLVLMPSMVRARGPVEERHGMG